MSLILAIPVQLAADGTCALCRFKVIVMGWTSQPLTLPKIEASVMVLCAAGASMMVEGEPDPSQDQDGRLGFRHYYQEADPARCIQEYCLCCVMSWHVCCHRWHLILAALDLLDSTADRSFTPGPLLLPSVWCRACHVCPTCVRAGRDRKAVPLLPP